MASGAYTISAPARLSLASDSSSITRAATCTFGFRVLAAENQVQVIGVGRQRGDQLPAARSMPNSRSDSSRVPSAATAT
jgi:hypothetical protein